MTGFTTIAVIIVSGIFILGFGAFLIWIILKYLPVKKLLKRFLLNRQRKKLLKDEKLLEYCVKRIEKNWKEEDIRKELLLSKDDNGRLKYSINRIEQVAFIFNIIKKELERGENGTSEGKGRTKNTISETYPE